jgi:hypothetical protein
VAEERRYRRAIKLTNQINGYAAQEVFIYFVVKLFRPHRLQLIPAACNSSRILSLVSQSLRALAVSKVDDQLHRCIHVLGTFNVFCFIAVLIPKTSYIKKSFDDFINSSDLSH